MNLELGLAICQALLQEHDSNAFKQGQLLLAAAAGLGASLINSGEITPDETKVLRESRAIPTDGIPLLA